jgi:MOSC domain-containing protein YiiM
MKLLSINIGSKGIIKTSKSGEQNTGIFKQPVDGPVQVTAEGLAGDYIANQKHHGGPDQAVYIYGSDDYDFWADELGRRIAPGLFGENLTISGLESAMFNVGDILRIGKVVLQVTSPRIPCTKFAAKIGDPMFIKKFKEAERPGIYTRVLRTGTLRSGDTVTREPYVEETVSILEMYREHYNPDKSEATLRRFLNAPIDIRSRVTLKGVLGEILSS